MYYFPPIGWLVGYVVWFGLVWIGSVWFGSAGWSIGWLVGRSFRLVYFVDGWLSITSVTVLLIFSSFHGVIFIEVIIVITLQQT
jgi:hypothetical protein